MKFASFLVFSIFSLPVLAGSVCESDQMNLQINHIEEIKGDLFVALHNSGDTYLAKDSEPFRSTVAEVVTRGSQQVSLCDVEAGAWKQGHTPFQSSRMRTGMGNWIRTFSAFRKSPTVFPTT